MGLRAQLHDARKEHGPQGRWQLRVVVASGDEQLLGEERVAVRARVDRSMRRASISGPAIALSIAPSSPSIERLEVQALDATGALRLREEREERVPTVDPLGPVRQDEHGPAARGGCG